MNRDVKIKIEPYGRNVLFCLRSQRAGIKSSEYREQERPRHQEQLIERVGMGEEMERRSKSMTRLSSITRRRALYVCFETNDASSVFLL